MTHTGAKPYKCTELFQINITNIWNWNKHNHFLLIIKILKCHMIKHLSGEPKKWPLCDYLPGTGEKLYKCNKCDKPFLLWNGSLKPHLMTHTHTGDKPNKSS